MASLIDFLSYKRHLSYLPSWKQAMLGGLIDGRVFSNRTVTDYCYYVEPLIQKHGTLSVKLLKEILMGVSPEQFAKREKLYKALRCFGKYLIAEGALNESFLRDTNQFKPRRHIPPKRLSIDEKDLESLYNACEGALDILILTILAETGIRASEACSLQWSDIDSDRQILIIRNGKWGKTRRLGLSQNLMECLQRYQVEFPLIRLGKHIFNNRLGAPMDRNGLYQRLTRIGQKAGINVSPHALRRAFVTLNANQGRPLQMLQIACGHSNITTTRSYCMTTEEEVIEAMKTWD